MTVTVRFDNVAGEQTMKVETIGDAKGDQKQVTVVFSSTRHLAETSLLRQQSAAVIYESYRGFRVPKEALRMEGDKYYQLAQKYMPNGTCGVVTFGVQGGRKAAETFMAGLKLASIATHVADAKTCVLHPASSTHRQMSDAELMAAGVSPDLIRLSVGIEDVKDILADLEQALEQV